MIRHELVQFVFLPQFSKANIFVIKSYHWRVSFIINKNFMQTYAGVLNKDLKILNIYSCRRYQKSGLKVKSLEQISPLNFLFRKSRICEFWFWKIARTRNIFIAGNYFQMLFKLLLICYSWLFILWHRVRFLSQTLKCWFIIKAKMIANVIQ